MSLTDIVQGIRDKYVLRPTGRELMRPIPSDLVRPPRYRYPSERHLIPENCGHCGVRLLVSDAPTAEHCVVDLSCLLCSRIACELLYDGVPVATVTNPIVIDPTLCLDCEERPRATRRRVCARCASRKKRAAAAALIARGAACIECREVPRTINSPRCAKCRHAKYRNGVGS